MGSHREDNYLVGINSSNQLGSGGTTMTTGAVINTTANYTISGNPALSNIAVTLYTSTICFQHPDNRSCKCYLLSSGKDGK